MTQHFTKNTVEASAWCPKCKKQTMHRVDRDEMQGRLGPCLVCMDKPSIKLPEPEPERQRSLF